MERHAMMAARREGRTEQGRTEQGRTAPGAARRDRREWMTLAEAAALVGVQPVTLRRAALVGTLVAQRSGKVWLTTEPDVRAWLRAARHRPGPRPGEGRGRPRPRKAAPPATREVPPDGPSEAPSTAPEEGNR